ncbi:uncharacterized protein A1O5_02752 [Cladophialophora psammophila CBS 110553]|uniref:Uncharacterized protein n=1 Tax=Cladophialophora psammophila CBS 110553 TaxID=1182543 RepID=W9XC08_9EURO|nr:uncharacterized protein A1O5_02752 [Cladophialophora psammophila CBS 110553]EXJ74456.1 hypothetical protein A1O5_02752 [Cladophialophora psammophila CBS 110553]
MSPTHHPINTLPPGPSQPIRDDAMMQFREIAPDRKREHESNLGLPTPVPPSQPSVKRTKTEQACSNCRALRRKVRPNVNHRAVNGEKSDKGLKSAMEAALAKPVKRTPFRVTMEVMFERPRSSPWQKR